MKGVRVCCVLAALAMLAACSLPGQRVEERWYDVVVQGDEPERGDFTLVRVTPDLIADLAAPGGAGPVQNPELQAALADYQYRVGPQDVLTFTVWDHPELTIPAGQFREAEIQGHLVDADGTIFFPYIGEVDVGGRTLVQIRDEVAVRLAEYIENPQLDVRVAAFRSQRVHVSGQVMSPGVVPVTDVPLTLVEAITRSGGGSPEAALQNVQVVRGGEAFTYNVQALLERGDMRQNLLLQGGDVVYVPENSYYSVHVLGEVLQPGSVSMPSGRLNLAEVITTRGGFDEAEADPERIFVFRGTPRDPSVFWLDGQSPYAMLLATQFQMQPQDVVFVATRGVARWNRLIAYILPTVQTLWQTETLLDRLDDDD